MEAAKVVLPLAEHRQCARHVYANFKKTYNGVDYKRLFWAAATSTTEASFLLAMDELKGINNNAYEYLVDKHPDTWCRAYFAEGRACEAVENGISESFNSVILEARTKPILTMLEEIRTYVMERFCRMSNKHVTWKEDVCPAILRKLKLRCADMRYYFLFSNKIQLMFNSHYMNLHITGYGLL